MGSSVNTTGNVTIFAETPITVKAEEVGVSAKYITLPACGVPLKRTHGSYAKTREGVWRYMGYC